MDPDKVYSSVPTSTKGGELNQTLAGKSHADVMGKQKFSPLEIYGVFATLFICFLKNTQNSALSIIGVALFLPFVFKTEFLIGPLYFFALFDDYLVAFNGQSFSRFISIFFILGWLLKSLMGGSTKIRKRESCFILIMALLGLALSMHGLFGYTSFPATYILCLTLAFCLMNEHGLNSDMVFNRLWVYSVIATLFCFFTVVREHGFFTDQRGTIADVNPNEFAFCLAILFCFVFSRFLVINFKKPLVHLSLMCILFVLLFISGSRTNMIAAVLSSLFVFFLLMKDHKVRGVKTVLIIWTVVLLAFAVLLFLQKFFPNLFSRFSVQDVLQSGGTGRVDIWRSYLKYYFPKYWAVGIGFDPLNMYYAIGVVGNAHGAHNAIIEILSCSGIVGLLLFGWLFIHSFRLLLSESHGCRYLLTVFGIFVCVIITGIGENVLTNKMLWFSIGIGLSMKNRLSR